MTTDLTFLLPRHYVNCKYPTTFPKLRSGQRKVVQLHKRKTERISSTQNNSGRCLRNLGAERCSIVYGPRLYILKSRLSAAAVPRGRTSPERYHWPRSRLLSHHSMSRARIHCTRCYRALSASPNCFIIRQNPPGEKTILDPAHQWKTSDHCSHHR